MLVFPKPGADFSRGVRIGQSATCFSRPTPNILVLANGFVSSSCPEFSSQ